MSFISYVSARSEVRNRTEQKRRRILMLFLVVAVFAICWFPINIYHLLADFQLINHNYKIFLVCHWFAMSSVCYNPFIYCWLNSTFRSGAKSLITLIIKCKRIQDNLSNNNSLTHHFNDDTSVNESRTKGITESIRLHHV